MWRFAALGVHRMSLKALLWTVAYLQYVTLCHMVGSYVLENSALCSCLHLFFYFARGSVCKVLWWVHLSSSVCVSVCEDISGTTWVVFTKCFMHVAYGRESGVSVCERVLMLMLWRSHGRRQKGSSRRHDAKSQDRVTDMDGLTAKQRKKVVSKAIISSSSGSEDEDQ